MISASSYRLLRRGSSVSSEFVSFLAGKIIDRDTVKPFALGDYAAVVDRMNNLLPVWIRTGLPNSLSQLQRNCTFFAQCVERCNPFDFIICII